MGDGTGYFAALAMLLQESVARTQVQAPAGAESLSVQCGGAFDASNAATASITFRAEYPA
jgi:hypothetical protein